MTVQALRFSWALLLVAASGCSSSSSTFTLYRNSVTDARMRIHVATFDSSEGRTYNQSNCEHAATLFQQQPRVEVAFWCEEGNFAP